MSQPAPYPSARPEAWPNRIQRAPSLHAAVPFDEHELEGSIPARFERVVARCPDKLAVESGSLAWTYAELDRQANRLASALLALAGPGPEPVALLLAHDAPQIAVTLGILKAGKFFTVLHPDYPLARLEFTLTDLATRWLITDRQHHDRAARLAPPGCRVLVLEELDMAQPDQNIGLSIPASAYSDIVYTSGSTGLSKGVVRTHHSTLYRSRIMFDLLAIADYDRLILNSRPVFSASVGIMFAGVLTGATILPFDVKQRGVFELLDWLPAAKPTVLQLPVGFYRQFVALLKPPQFFPSLRLVDLAGDIVYRQDIERFRPFVRPDCAFVHRYGASEAELLTFYAIDLDQDTTPDELPAGYPTPGREVLIMNQERQPVAPGEVGEVVIRSRTMAEGYWRRPDLTAERFADDPDHPGRRLYFTGDQGRLRANGCLELLGRIDFQVKVRGYRVAPTAIESALLDLPAIREAAVVAQPGPNDEKRLIAYVVLRDKTLATDEIRGALAQKVPEYMLPSMFIPLDAMPLTANGKINRRDLPVPDRRRPTLAVAFAPPETDTERAIAAIWRTVLGVDSIGIHDGFLELGGDSLLAAQVLARINAELLAAQPVDAEDWRPTVGALLRVRTVAEMARLLDARRRAATGQPLPPLLEAVESLSEAEAQQLLHTETPSWQ